MTVIENFNDLFHDVIYFFSHCDFLRLLRVRRLDCGWLNSAAAQRLIVGFAGGTLSAFSVLPGEAAVGFDAAFDVPMSVLPAAL
jgi:hypothetical protein